MRIEPLKNQSIGNFRVGGVRFWTVGNENQPQIFRISVSAENGEKGHVVGLTQTLLESTRRATFDGNGILDRPPSEGPPILDADADMKPWYNNECEGKALPADGTAIEFEMKDSPAAYTLTSAKSDNSWKNLKMIKDFTVSEKFVLSLIDTGKKKNDDEIGEIEIIKQWTWSYQYQFLVGNTNGEPDNRATPIENTAFTRSTECVEATSHIPIKLEGPVATDRNFHHDKWTPEDWKGFNEDQW